MFEEDVDMELENEHRKMSNTTDLDRVESEPKSQPTLIQKEEIPQPSETMQETNEAQVQSEPVHDVPEQTIEKDEEEEEKDKPNDPSIETNLPEPIENATAQKQVEEEEEEQTESWGKKLRCGFGVAALPFVRQNKAAMKKSS